MMKNCVCLAAALLAAACTSPEGGVTALIPAPAEISMGEGFFRLHGDKGIEVVIEDSLTGDCHPESAEGYTLDVTPEGVKITAAGEAGAFYARQTLDQLAQAGKVPCVHITDYPRFSWRGFHVDPCRHFLSVEDTKRQIDVLAKYKINVMHWHLTDDQGWRIEIKKWPLLTKTGAWRTEFDGSVHGGFYTQEEVKEVVAYAAERHITVVPEIEMPGHAMAAIRAYPELSCEKKPIGTFYTWGTSNVVFCPGQEETFEFLEDVVAEVAPLFPGEYFHLGGDECLKDKWEVCPACQARIRAEGLKADESGSAVEKLQSYAVQRMEKILAAYGKKAVGWDEILQGGLSKSATVMSWQGEKGGIAAAKAGNFVVMTPSHEGMYLDSYQGDPKCEPEGFGRDVPLKKVYDYDPVPAELAQAGAEGYVLGLQGNLWSEYIYSTAHREYMLFPRILAIAETGWTPAERKDWEDFSRRVDAHAARLGSYGVNYHIPLPQQPEGSCDRLAFTDSLSVSFVTTRPEKMLFTLNGRTPGRKSAQYTSPLTFTESGTIKIRTVLPGGQMSPVRTVTVTKEQPAPAAQTGELRPGLTLRKTYGRFTRVSEMEKAEDWQTVEISDLREITSQEERPRDMQDVKFYGAVATGYFNVPKTGVWRFSSVNDQLWIDGKLLIDNDGTVRRHSTADAETALEKGLHEIKIVFLSNVSGGWTSSRNNGGVEMMLRPEGSWHRLKPNALYH